MDDTLQQSAAAGFVELAQQRRSIRRYQQQPIPRELLTELVDTATRAPSNFNRQAWQFFVVDQTDWIVAVNELIRRAVDEVERRDTTGELYNFLDHVRQWLYPLQGAQALILCFYKPSPERVDQQMATSLGDDDVMLFNPNLISLGMAIQNMLLAAEAHGLGGCMHSGPLVFLRGQVNKLLNLPAKLQLAGLVSLGWPDESPDAPKHRDLSRVLSFCDGPVPEAWQQVWAETTV